MKKIQTATSFLFCMVILAGCASFKVDEQSAQFSPTNPTLEETKTKAPSEEAQNLAHIENPQYLRTLLLPRSYG